MKTYIASLVISTSLALVACGESSTPVSAPDKVQSNTVAKEQKQTTTVTEDNYGLAESQVILGSYVQRIADATATNGMGVWMHNKLGADPKDRTIMRINFDTLYSFAVVDLTDDAVLTMPETGGRYQSAWIITDEHYNPMAFIKPGTYTLTRENVGSRYAMIAMRTQANTADPADLVIANKLQEQLLLEQKSRGSWEVSNNWDMAEILKIRAVYSKIAEEEGITSDVMFGKKGEVPLKEHNVGTAAGWGGFTAERAVYPSYHPDNNEPHTLTLKAVPASAFWSITVYDEEGYPQGEFYNINSEFVLPNEDGSVTIHFGGDDKAINYMDIYDGWNITLRIYEPTEAYFNGDWVRPELEQVK